MIDQRLMWIERHGNPRERPLSSSGRLLQANNNKHIYASQEKSSRFKCTHSMGATRWPSDGAAGGGKDIGEKRRPRIVLK